MKKLFYSLMFLCIYLPVLGQEDTGKDMLTFTAITVDDPRFSSEVIDQLQTKMEGIILSNGAYCGEGSRFLMTSKIDVTEKDVTSKGMILHKILVTLYIIDAFDGRCYASKPIRLIGAGDSETKSLIKAIQTIKPGDSQFSTFMQGATNSIVTYFKENCDQILAVVDNNIMMGKYEDAMKMLLTVPSICKEEYSLCQAKVYEIYLAKQKEIQEAINKDGLFLIQKARSAWTAKQDIESAQEALALLAKVDPCSECRKDADELLAQINDKMRKDEAAKAAAAKAEWEFKVKHYEDNLALEKQRQADKTAVLKSMTDNYMAYDLIIQREIVRRFLFSY